MIPNEGEASGGGDGGREGTVGRGVGGRVWGGLPWGLTPRGGRSTSNLGVVTPLGTRGGGRGQEGRELDRPSHGSMDHRENGGREGGRGRAEGNFTWGGGIDRMY